MDCFGNVPANWGCGDYETLLLQTALRRASKSVMHVTSTNQTLLTWLEIWTDFRIYLVAREHIEVRVVEAQSGMSLITTCTLATKNEQVG